MDMDMDSEESPIDLTDASDEEILKVFKAMGEEDGIIVKKDGEDIHLSDTDTDSEYLVKLGESEEDEEELDEAMHMDEMDDMDLDTEDVINAIFSKDGDVEDIDMEDEEVMYEIEFNEEDDDMMEEEDDDMMEEEDDDMMEQEDDDMMEQEDDDMMEQEDDDMMEQEDDDMMEEEDLDESYNHRRAVREGKSTVKPKGVGIGSGPKFTYKSKAAGGFKEDKKEGPKTMGTGKPKFEYKKGENMEQKSKVVKAETKEGAYGMNKGDKSKTMKGKEDFTTKKGDTLKRKAFEKEETKEAARTYGMGSKEGRGLRKGITNNRNYVYGKNGVKVESTESEVNMLRDRKSVV
jgi:hypothetical protein